MSKTDRELLHKVGKLDPVVTIPHEISNHEPLKRALFMKGAMLELNIHEKSAGGGSNADEKPPGCCQPGAKCRSLGSSRA